jgi:hypothetical protein
MRNIFLFIIAVIIGISVLGISGCITSPLSQSQREQNEILLNNQVDYNMRNGNSPYSDLKVPIGDAGYLSMPNR